MRLVPQSLELRAGDRVGDGVSEAGRQDHVALGGQDQRWHRDVRQAIDPVVRETDVHLRLERLDGLLVRKGKGPR